MCKLCFVLPRWNRVWIQWEWRRGGGGSWTGRRAKVTKSIFSLSWTDSIGLLELPDNSVFSFHTCYIVAQKISPYFVRQDLTGFLSNLSDTGNLIGAGDSLCVVCLTNPAENCVHDRTSPFYLKQEVPFGLDYLIAHDFCALSHRWIDTLFMLSSTVIQHPDKALSIRHYWWSH